MTSVVLLCAVLSSLAGGILLAYGLCFGMFHLFRMHSMQAFQARETARQASVPLPPVVALDTAS